MITAHSRYYIWIWFFAIAGCDNPSSQVVLMLDMNAEVAAGRFDPIRGDKVYVAGDFDNWGESDCLLTETSNKNVFRITKDCLSRMSENVSSSAPSYFKFKVETGDNRHVANQGWESIGERELDLDHGGPPTFVFNRERLSNNEAFVEFAVDVSNQITLGYFDVQSSKVWVSGDFIDWEMPGVELQKSRDAVYAIKTKVVFGDDGISQYKYRISSDKLTIPQQWVGAQSQ